MVKKLPKTSAVECEFPNRTLDTEVMRVERSCPECSEKRTMGSLLGKDKPKQTALRLEGYTASLARLNLHMRVWMGYND